MSNRTLRVNELIQRELSDILRKHYQAEAVIMTVTEVRVTPDLREGRVFISIVAEPEEAKLKLRWLRKKAAPIRKELSQRIVLKYLPKLEYVLDDSAERGTRIVQLLEEVERADRASAKE